MKRLAANILKHRLIVLIVFALALIVSIFLIPTVNIDYNLTDYVPDQAKSTIALHTMQKEFNENLPDAQVMIPVKDFADALRYKVKLQNLPCVKKVLWLDDQIDPTVPLAMRDPKLVEGFYKDGKALYQVTADETQPLGKTMRALQDIAGKDGAVGGQLVSLARSQISASSELGRILLFILPISLLILILATSSWIEPLLFILTIMISVGLNMGSNVMFKSISFITQAVVAVLQLAVSMDYSVFLLHSFSRFRHQGEPIEHAMQHAIVESFSSITASALTTFFGFLTLVFMRFKIGPDMGFVLAKGIAFSLISVLFLLPTMVMYTYKLIDKTYHRPFLPSFKRLSKLVLKLRWPILIIAFLIAAPTYLAQQSNTFLYGIGEFPVTSKEYHDKEVIANLFGKTQQMVLLVPRGQTAKEAALASELLKIPEMTSVIGYTTEAGAALPTEIVPEDKRKALLSQRYSRYFLIADSPEEAPETYALAERIRALVHDYFGDSALLAGANFSLLDMRDTVRQDNIIVNGLAILAVGLVILFTFRSLLLPFILVLTIELAIWINLSVPYFTNTSLNFIGYLVISTVQLGSTVDYAILLTRHYLDQRKFMGKIDAARMTLQKTAGSIIPPALILASAGFVLGSISGITIVSELGIVLGRGALLTLLLVIFLLPALLIFFDRAIEKTTWKTRFYRPALAEPGPSAAVPAARLGDAPPSGDKQKPPSIEPEVAEVPEMAPLVTKQGEETDNEKKHNE